MRVFPPKRSSDADVADFIAKMKTLAPLRARAAAASSLPWTPP